MAKSLPVVPATPVEVRAFVSALVEAGKVTLTPEGQHNLTSRGRIGAEVREAHNSQVTPARRYVEGQSVKRVPLNYRRVTASGARTAVTMLPESEVRDLARRAGAKVGARGPLSDAAVEAAGVQFEADRQSLLSV